MQAHQPGAAAPVDAPALGDYHDTQEQNQGPECTPPERDPPPRPLRRSPSLRDARQWASIAVTFAPMPSPLPPGYTIGFVASASLPLPPRVAFELVTHADGADAGLFRGMSRCTYRRVLQTSPCGGRMVVDVENESLWRLFGASGTARTRMLALQDEAALTLSVVLAEHAGQQPLHALAARWSVAPAPGGAPDGCVLTIEQLLTPRGVPRVLHGAVARIAHREVRQTFEDLALEACKIRAGVPTLKTPWREASTREVPPPAAPAGAAPKPEARPPADPASVVEALEEMLSSSASSGGSSRAPSRGGSDAGGGGRRAAAASAGGAGPCAHRVPDAELLSGASEDLELLLSFSSGFPADGGAAPAPRGWRAWAGAARAACVTAYWVWDVLKQEWEVGEEEGGEEEEDDAWLSVV